MNNELITIQQDIAEIKCILAILVGAADRSVEHPFSEEEHYGEAPAI